MKLRDYHDHPALSPTKLKAALTLTGWAYWRRHLDPSRKPFVPTDPMRQGSLIDVLLTTPDQFQWRYEVVKTPTIRKADRERVAGSDIELITTEWYERGCGCVDALMRNLDVSMVLRDRTAQSQVPHFFDHGEYKCRALPDIITRDGVYDLKKVPNADPAKMRYHCYGMAYDVQMLHLAFAYQSMTGTWPANVGIIGVEWAPPHDNCMLMLSDQTLDDAITRWLDAAEKVTAAANGTPSLVSYGVEEW